MNKLIWCEISILALTVFLTATSNGLCRKLEKLTELHISGYKSHIIHSNACIEVRKSIIEPNILDLEVPSGERFRRTLTTSNCCCQVTSKTLELVGDIPHLLFLPKDPLRSELFPYRFCFLYSMHIIAMENKYFLIFCIIILWNEGRSFC